MDTLKQAVTMEPGRWDLIATPDGMETMSNGAAQGWTVLIVRPTQRGARLGGLRRVRLRLGSKSTIPAVGRKVTRAN